MKQVVLLLIASILMVIVHVTAAKLDVTTGVFGIDYAFNVDPGKTVSLLYANAATNACSLKFDVTLPSSAVYSHFHLKLDSPDVKGYKSLMRDYPEVSLLGVYTLTAKDLVMGTTMLYSLQCPNGMMNVDPYSMQFFYLTNAFVGVQPRTQSPTVFTYQNEFRSTSNGLFEFTVGVGAKITPVSAKAYGGVYFFGPSSINYPLKKESGIVSESLDIYLPSAAPVLQPYTVSLKENRDIAPSIQVKKSTEVLYAFKLDVTGNPSMAQLAFAYNFGSDFTNLQEKKVDIQRDTLKMMASTDNSAFIQGSCEFRKQTTLHCAMPQISEGSFKYLYIIASEQQHSNDIPTEIYEGSRILTGSISERVTYVIAVPARMRLSLTGLLNLLSSQDGRIIINPGTAQFVSIIVKASSNFAINTLSLVNEKDTPQPFIIAVEPVTPGTTTNIAFTPLFQKVPTDPTNPTPSSTPVFNRWFIIGISISGLTTLTSIIAVVIVICTIRKQNKNNKSQQIEEGNQEQEAMLQPQLFNANIPTQQQVVYPDLSHHESPYTTEQPKPVQQLDQNVKY